MKKDTKEQQRVEEEKKSDEKKNDYDYNYNYNYVSRLDKKLAFIKPHCICGNEKMIGKINNCGMWVITGKKYITRPNYSKNKDGCFYQTPILYCNKCRSKIESFDGYYSCNNRSFVTDTGHEHGFRVCKICAILQKSRLFDKISLSHSVKIDEKCHDMKKQNIVTKLGDDTWFLIFQFGASSHMNIIHFCQISTQFNSLFCPKFSNSIESKPNHNTISDEDHNDYSSKDTKAGIGNNDNDKTTQNKSGNDNDILNTLGISSDDTHTNDDEKKQHLKENRLVIDPRLNSIWKHLVLYYWPFFMSQSMVDTYSTKIYQRWDLFFKIRFLSMKQYIKKRDKKNDTIPMRKRSGDKGDYGKNSGKYVGENSLLRGYIEGCDKQIKEMFQIGMIHSIRISTPLATGLFVYNLRCATRTMNIFHT